MRTKCSNANNNKKISARMFEFIFYIEFSVNYLSQFLSSYGHEHWQAVKKIIRYLKGTINIRKIYGSSKSELTLKGFTDADYAACFFFL